ncbi:MAG: hypothetical protein RIR19_828, partial [Chloroflexota bacterium]
MGEEELHPATAVRSAFGACPRARRDAIHTTTLPRGVVV